MVVRLGHASSAGLVLDLTAGILQWKPLVPQGVQGLCLPPPRTALRAVRSLAMGRNQVTSGSGLHFTIISPQC